jgi:outer membrane protein OmpA-like peptidoglycan-associated protein
VIVMNRIRVAHAVVPAVLAAAAVACGGQPMPPKSLVDARSDYVHVKDGVASQLDPTDVHEADLALQRAESAFANDPNDPSTDDLAMIADRKALIAQARAQEMQAEQREAQANREIEESRTAALQQARGQLNAAQQALGTTQMQLEEQERASDEQQRKLHTLEANLMDARDTIARIAAVKDDERGMVITLQGEVLFKTGKWDLKPGAMAKLDEIADALKGKEQPIAVYGFTDNVGTRDNNLELSQRRADSVRSYLANKGIPQDLLSAQGKGPDVPVADNQSIEGRAQNRRVEIVVEPKAKLGHTRDSR